MLAAWQDELAIDHHCHPLRRWPLTLAANDLRTAFSESLDRRIADEHSPHTVVYRDALKRIAGRLGCAADEEAILKARSSRDPAAYSNELMEATSTRMLLLDTGFTGGDAFTFQEHQKAVNIPQRQIVRLETLAEKLIPHSSKPADWFEAVAQTLRQAKRDGAAGIKTIAAYRAGLRLGPLDPDEVDRAYATARKQAQSAATIRLTGQALVHSLLFEAAEVCNELDLPLQVHCGFGDPDEDLAECSPLGLRPLLIDSRYRGLKLALLHCYPFHREAAYLCSVFPDVYMDLSLAIPMAGQDGVRALSEALGLCPWSKLLYATDATRLPEVYFVAAAVHREALASAFGELIDRGTLTLEEATAAGRMVLSDNARGLYALG